MKMLGFGAIVWDDIPDKRHVGMAVGSLGEIRAARNIGGAVFNVAVHAKRLGAEAYILAAIGKDELGKRTIEVVKAKGITTDLLKTVDKPTCVVRVRFAEDGEPLYLIDENVSWDFVTVSQADIDFINKKKFDYFCFGTIEQRNPVSQKALVEVIEKCRFGCLYLDINLRAPFYSKQVIEYSLGQCNIAKLNLDEVKRVNEMFGLSTSDVETLMARLRETFDIDQIVVTDGASGVYFSSDKESGFCPAYKVEISDTVGAGDAFSAGLISRLGSGEGLENACDFGCKMGALIASRTSSIPEYDLSEIDALHIRNEIHSEK